MSIAVVIAGLLVLILIHEAGHFLVAKAVGARATKFYLGFPPAVFRRRRGDTEYGIGAIPLGGYVRIVGMTRPQAVDLFRIQDAADEAAHRREGGLDELTPAVRRLRDALAAQELDRVPDLAAAALDTLESEREVLHAQTHRQARRDLVRLAEEADPRAYWRLAVWRRIAIIFAGPGANIVAAFVILVAFLMIGVPRLESTRSVDAVQLGSAAQRAGLRAGDEVVAVNGRPVTRPVQISTAIQGSNGQPVRLTVRRQGVERQLTPQAPRRSDGRWLLGFVFRAERVGTDRVGPVEATRRSFDYVVSVSRATLEGLARIFTDQGRKDVSTPVGIVDQTSGTVGQGSFPAVLAFISLALAIFNLLPFLPLDGGHILFAVIERLRGGRPVPRVVFERVSVVGIALMLMLFVVGLTNDIGRLNQP